MPINPILGRQAFQPTSLAAAMMQRGQRIEQEAQARAKPWAAVAERAGAGAKEALEAHQIEQAERPGKLFNLLSQQKKLDQMDVALELDESKLDQEYAENTLNGIDRVVRQAVNLGGTEQETEAFFRQEIEALRKTGLGNISRLDENTPHPETEWRSYDNLLSRYTAMIDPEFTEGPIWDDGEYQGEGTKIRRVGDVTQPAPDWDLVEVTIPETGKELVLQFDKANAKWYYPAEEGLPAREAFGPFEKVEGTSGIFHQTTYMYDPLFGADRPVIRRNDNTQIFDGATGAPLSKDTMARLQKPLSEQETAKQRAAVQMRAMLTKMEELGFGGDNPIFAGEGLGQKFTNAFRALKAYAGYDPDMRMMMSLRTAAAAQAAVTQQGARPSDFDTKGTWLPLVPHGVWNTEQEARMMFSVLRDWVDATNRPYIDWRGEQVEPDYSPASRNEVQKKYMERQMRQFDKDGVRMGDLMIGPRNIMQENDKGQMEYVVFRDENGLTQPQFYRANQNSENYAGGDWQPFNTKEQVVETLIGKGLSADEASAVYDEIMEADAAEVTKALDDPSFAGTAFYNPNITNRR
jgi:hypothetical protein